MIVGALSRTAHVIAPVLLPRVSVVVPTRNRAAALRTALRSLARQDDDSPAFEVLVVDNGSTDDTSCVVAEFTSTLALRYLHEPAVGVCNARNTGWRAARGEYVACLDDDAVACPAWVKAIVEGFAPDVAAVDGSVAPIWPVSPPRWLSDEIAVGLTIVNWSPRPMFLSDLSAHWLEIADG